MLLMHVIKQDNILKSETTVVLDPASVQGLCQSRANPKALLRTITVPLCILCNVWHILKRWLLFTSMYDFQVVLGVANVHVDVVVS